MLLNRPVTLRVMEDNTAAITDVEKGYTPAMRQIKRTQKLCLGFLKELIHGPQDPVAGPILLEYSPTDVHKGDAFTKELETAAKFLKGKELIGLVRPRA